MLFKSKHVRAALLMAASAAPALITGCSAHVGYRVYDPYYSDYHVWGPRETVYYNRWVADNHRDNVEFRQLSREDQHQVLDMASLSAGAPPVSRATESQSPTRPKRAPSPSGYRAPASILDR